MAGAGAPSILDVNLRVLRERFPHVHLPESTRSRRFRVQPTGCGAPTFQFIKPTGEAVWGHSQFDPRAEGDQLAAHWVRGEGFYIVLGFGLGYHVASMIRRLPRGSRILVAEPDAELFALALESVPLAEILRFPNLSLAIGTEANLRRELQQADLAAVGQEPRICVHPSLARFSPDVFKRWQDVIRSEFNRALVEVKTAIRWDLTWGQNTMENLPRVLASFPVRALFGRFEGVPGFIVAAGPSLSHNVATLKAAEGRAVIIAVDTALRVLLSHDIRPDLVIAFDGGAANYRHFQGLTYDEIPLVYDPMVYPAIPGEHRGQQWVMETPSNLFMAWLRGVLGSVGLILSGGSIATAALDLAVKLGCNPVAFVGQDLAYRDGYTHARGTAHEGRRVESMDERKHIRVPAVDGGTVWTDRVWYSYLTWFEQYIATAPPRLRFVDATEGGALIRGTSLMRLRDFIDRFVTGSVDVSSILDAAADQSLGSTITVEQLEAHLAEGVRVLREVARITKRAAREAEEAVRQVQLGRTGGNRFRKSLKALDETDRFLKELDRAVYALLQPGTFRTALRVRRAGHSGAGAVSQPDFKSVLDWSRELYSSIALAAERTAEIINAGCQYVRR